ncbi:MULTISPECIES: hypothetical protein [Mesorhizobium]|jgi:hypothetical protein|uniref:Uncharacterized protein n=1 Tax=Rhizobium loti TaxID=381 RepID=A0A8E2WHU5_RHILI|nr:MULTISPECIES: hypothetical protein [Mesorhizobium]AZO44423.1 hypothetical protein EJ076_26665 [Mesorhizobium sp. M7D.F.Ca.US.005.01.1.1]PWJ94708.1 hypothetical protein C8D77_1011394 [Mesorhizobium loti]RUX93705.1 hypothetical protein EN993_18390 [Mesorhizobium sp. M7D.F.Ca.US.004.01.2.1]
MPLTLRTTLCETRDALHVLRRALSVRGHIEAMEEIDSLIGVAEQKAVHAIGDIDRAEFRKPILVVVANPAMSEDILIPVALPTRLGELREQGMGLSAYCGNARCGHLRSLDLDGLIEIYGTHYDFITEKRLASKLVCKRCQNVGGRLVVVSDKRPRY